MGEANVNIDSLLQSFGQERRLDYALDSFKTALLSAGSPEQNVKSIVIAGTNGKGSVTLLTTNALAKSGMKVASYMSPHLQHVTERFLLNGTPIEEKVLSDLGNRYIKLAKTHGLSYFEFLTLLFFVWAKEIGAEVLVLEVGLGGRLDATNVTSPVACAVTSIDYDHMEVLGDTLDKILNEKLAVVPKGGTLVSGLTQPVLIQQAQNWCKEKQARFISRGEVLKATGIRDWTGQEVSLGDKRFTLATPNPRWIENANTAYALLKTAFPEFRDDLILKAFEETRFPGRFEVFGKTPLVVLSGDHNPAGISSLIETIGALQRRKIHTLCAFSLDKPYDKMFATLKNVSESITLTSFSKQGKITETYKRLTPNFNPDPHSALTNLVKRTPKEDIVLITGSLYLVGELRGFLDVLR